MGGGDVSCHQPHFRDEKTALSFPTKPLSRKLGAEVQPCPISLSRGYKVSVRVSLSPSRRKLAPSTSDGL